MERIEGARTATHPPGLLLTYIEACGFAHRETVRETATTVTVRLSRHRFPGDPQCIDLGLATE